MRLIREYFPYLEVPLQLAIQQCVMQYEEKNRVRVIYRTERRNKDSRYEREVCHQPR